MLPYGILFFVCLVELPLLIFHAGVLCFVLSQYVKRSKVFFSGFYAIYIVQSFIDIVNVPLSFVIIRLAGYNEDVANFLTDGPWCTLLLYLSGFFTCSQFLYHTAIAFNRYSALLDPTGQKRWWSGRNLAIILFAISVFAALLASSRLFATYHVVQAGDRYGLLNARPATIIATACLSGGSSFVTSAVSGFVELRTLISFRRLDYAIRHNRRDDFRLLAYALTQFVAQALMTSFYLAMAFCQLFAPQFATVLQGLFPYITDLLSLSGPVCIMITSRDVRKGFLSTITRRAKFLGKRTDDVQPVSAWPIA